MLLRWPTNVPSLLELPEAHGRFVANIADEILAATPAAIRAEKAEAETALRLKQEEEARDEAREEAREATRRDLEMGSIERRTDEL
jgi:hypothetical protein